MLSHLVIPVYLRMTELLGEAHTLSTAPYLPLINSRQCASTTYTEDRAGLAGQDGVLERGWMGLKCYSEGPEVHIPKGHRQIVAG